MSQEDPLGEGIATPVLLPEEPHRQRNLVDYSPWGCRELEGLNRLSTHIPVLGVNRIVGSVPAAAAAKSLQSCPTLCDPIDGSPPGSPVPGILQARTLEWGAIAFSRECTYCLPNPLTKGREATIFSYILLFPNPGLILTVLEF